jgi:hypothetical protein
VGVGRAGVAQAQTSRLLASAPNVIRGLRHRIPLLKRSGEPRWGLARHHRSRRWCPQV